MTQDKERAGRRRTDLDASDLTPERRVAGTWESPRDLDRGGVSAEDTARPRDPEAIEGAERTPAGFTTTSPTGSMGGRSLYGEEPASEEDFERRQRREEE